MLSSPPRVLVLGALVSALAWAGCGKGSMQAPNTGAGGDATGGTGGSGGAGGDDGGAPDGGDGSVVPPACDPSASTMGRVSAPSPLISVGKPVTASTGVVTPEKAVDGMYHNGGSGTKIPVASAAPFAWVAINVGAGPDRVLLTWTDAGFNAYNMVTGGSPTGYEIATSGDSTDGSDGTWETVVTVTANPVRTRAHTFAFTGKSWVKFTVTAGAAGGAFIDEIEVHDVTQAGSGRPTDTWFFMGDSITQGAFNRNFVDSFDLSVKTAHPGYFPAMFNGGIGGELSNMGVAHIDQWLELNPDVQHFAIMYGSNDAAGDALPSSTTFQANMTTIVEKVLAAGRVPILARIPYSTTGHAHVADFNAIVDALVASHGLPCGPDLYAYFMAHPDQLADGLHPTSIGYNVMNQLWADDVSPLYPN